MNPSARIERLAVSAYVVPTDAPESDGTFEWTSTTLVLCEIAAGGLAGFGYGYASRAAAAFVSEALTSVVVGRDAFDIPAMWTAMRMASRNQGHRGIASAAV